MTNAQLTKGMVVRVKRSLRGKVDDRGRAGHIRRFQFEPYEMESGRDWYGPIAYVELFKSGEVVRCTVPDLEVLPSVEVVK